MKQTLNTLIPSFLLALSFNAYALVDYSDPVSGNELQTNRMSTKVQAERPQLRSALIWKSDFSLTTNYEALQLNNDKAGLLNFNTHIQTPFNVFFDLSYWQLQSKAGSQSGNPKFLLGFNWLRFGAPSDEARLDIFGGGRFSGSSEMASTRTDKIFGVETTKRFGTFGLGLGYGLTMTGAPKKESEMALGNIHRIVVSGGWMVSNDIQFEVELENFKVNPASDQSWANRLSETASFSTLSPKLNLTIVPAVNLEMGARFRTNKPKSESVLRQAKLMDHHGAYSNSLFAGLNLNI